VRRRTGTPLLGGDRLLLPGSPAMTLDQLLAEAEHEVREASVAGSTAGGSPERELGPASPALGGIGLGFRAHANAFATPMRPGAGPRDEAAEPEQEEAPAEWQETFFNTPVQAPVAIREPTPEPAREPSPAPSMFERAEHGPREWAKDDWKLLDACYTDARLDAGAAQGLPAGELADVDAVQLDDVVDRFCEAVPIGLLGWDRYVVFRTSFH
jgi:hypothetical protein